MAAFNFKKWDTLVGWAVFAIALITYSLTVEPTMSFWDCGEYIATAAKLEVGHPPGAPLFQMMGAFFAMFAFSKEHIALMVNMMSVFSSAFTILFMFWSSTIILRKIIQINQPKNEISKTTALAILGSVAVGSLAFTFSDSFWFNAVEAEVYAMASLFISLLFWLGLRWEQEMENARGNKWLLVISLIVGLSFGVHFMALLTIPSIGLLYYFKHYKTTTVKNFIVANIVVVSVLLFIFLFLLPLTMAFFGKSEVFVVNSFGLPFNSGTILVTLILIAFFYFGLRYTKKKNLIQINTVILCILFIFIGFSTWLMLPIRANSNTPINENKPSDAQEVLAYYNREQYGSNPLFFGPQFSDTYGGLDKDNPYLDKKPNYERDYSSGKYVIVNNYKNAEQNSDDRHKAFLPRMWSTDGDHPQNYMNFTHPLEFRINPEYDYVDDLSKYGIDPKKLSEEELAGAEQQLRSEVEKTIKQFRTAFAQHRIDNEGYIKFLKTYSEYLIIDKPTTSDNFGFMVEYQFGYMYWRYLMWNFTGRQNDIQGTYDNMNGNWISGIKFIDELRLGSQENLPDDALKNKGRNTYFFLPFLLGLMGLWYHAKKDLKSFYVLMALFLFTGLALKIYLNERPFEPRERDYALVGSFYVFSIWIGFGTYAIFDFLKKYLQPKIAAPIVVGVCLLSAPVLMATQNWNDHDRSQRYTAIAMAKNYLNSCAPNAILFTIGDNDTFPLWYAQEIENVRTDIKIVNTSLINTDWYIDQMKRKTYASDGLPISFSHSQYVGDKLDYVAFNQITDQRMDIHKFLEFIKSDDERTMIPMRNGLKIHFYPTDKIRIPVDKNQIIKDQVVSAKFNDSIVPYIDVDIKTTALYKNRLMMFDIVANNNWKRPIYFTGGSFGDDDYLWMKDYLELDGMVYRLVPVKNPMGKAQSPLDLGQIDSEKMFQAVMNWDWGNGNSQEIYQDPETRKNGITYRTNLARLMEQLIHEKQTEKAKKIIDLAIDKMPVDMYGYYTLVEPFAEGYYEVGETQKAQKLLGQLIEKYKQNLDFYRTLKSAEQQVLQVEIITDIERFRSLLEVMKSHNDLVLYQKNKTIFNSYNQVFKDFKRDNEN